jgi:hypothetical protein
MSHDSTGRAAVLRHLPIGSALFVVLVLGVISAAFASLAAAQTQVKGTIAIGDGTAGNAPGGSSPIVGASDFQLYTGSDLPSPLTGSVPSDDYPETVQANSTNNNTGYTADYTLLFDGSTGLTLGSAQSDPSPYGEILNSGLDQQDFDSYEFDVYTSAAPEIYYTGVATPSKGTVDGYYELDGVTGEFVTSSKTDLTPWTVNWWTSSTPFTYAQGANTRDVSGIPEGGSSSSPVALDSSSGFDYYTSSKSHTGLTGSNADAGGYTTGGGRTQSGNLIGVYNPTTKAIALEWSSLIYNSSSSADSFNGDFGIWNLQGTL